MLVIVGMVILCYGLIPLVGGMVRRYKWYVFRRRFDELRLCPMLDYQRYRQQGEHDTGGSPAPAVFRFVGGFESVTDGKTLWIRGDDLTIPVSLKNAETYLLPTTPKSEDPADDEVPQRIRWERVSALTEGAQVFIGGLVARQDGRRSFVSTKEHPLIVIFYDGPEESLAGMVIRAGRQRGDYWNTITPYALVLGALGQILIAVQYIPRPAFRFTVIASFIAMFIPLYPIIPPGLLFTAMYRHICWRSRMLRIDSSLAETRTAARSCVVKAYTLETLAWLVLLAGIGLNIFFLSIVLTLL